MKKILITKAGRKYQYLALEKNKEYIPAVYFKKSKWISQKEFEKVVEFIIDKIKL